MSGRSCGSAESSEPMRRLTLALALLAFLPAEPTRAAEAATGVVKGSVKVLKKGFFGRIGESDDKSGVLLYVTGYDEPAPGEVAQLVQQNEKFAPRILPIVAGQTVSFPN